MNKEEYEIVENYMNDCMRDSAHDKLHIYRVLYHAVEISKQYTVDDKVLITATLLHDIGREQQIKNPKLNHAEIGAQMACEFLTSIGWKKKIIDHICDCISSHRFRSNNPPNTIEAKILFDADKLDVTGAVGIARTLAYKGAVGQMLYSVNDKGTVVPGNVDDKPTFLHEYCFKLEGLYNKFYTEVAREMALERQKAAMDYYNNFYNEMDQLHKDGQGFLNKLLT